jgi:hypothetical protein
MARDVPPGASLEDLAKQYLGNSRYAISIALATNARTGEGFRYIGNPEELTGVARICIPSKAEAHRLQRSWDVYENAVVAARLPRRAAASRALVVIPPDEPVTVVAWVRKDQADRLKMPEGDWIKAAPADTWVTVEPHLREFCNRFARGHAVDDSKLTQRLEQRLGLSPASSKAVFVRMQVDRPGPETIFRPCSDPVASRGNCSTGEPKADSGEAYQNWFYRQYYSSYGQSLISEFPWTALGYTFDWAPPENGTRAARFARTGESEFVIRKGAAVTVLETLPTMQYCQVRP